ncbi:hypothetical protein OIU91_04000 [Streptomyces sp. NBC_01456]|uniref:hypothetical protein n=1 Tax=unclassified Streptomyces TaxID=2593676 RepID=UPI002E346D07|nr:MULTISPECIES: hypothetical protein [unclassified Streptomyces]
MTTAERLIARLREAGLDLPEGSRLVRVYPSRAMRNEGAWSWSAFGPGGRELQLGSQYPMAELLAAEKLDTMQVMSGAVGSDTEVFPAKACQRCQGTAVTACRICRAPLCSHCFTDHHHEGYGAPATESR